MTPPKSSPSGTSARKKKQKRAKSTVVSDQAEQQENADTMAKCVELCQQQRWREALLMCRRMLDKARSKNDTEMLTSLENARVKIEYSLRRQMAAALIAETQTLLSKEYLLDVGE